MSAVGFHNIPLAPWVKGVFTICQTVLTINTDGAIKEAQDYQ